VGIPCRPRVRLPAHVRSPVLFALEQTLAQAARRLDAVDPPPEPFADETLRPVLRIVPRSPSVPRSPQG
jgi:hypothetical protein